MEQQYKKSFIEKFGDFYSKKRNRFLLGLAVVFLGFCFGNILPTVSAVIVCIGFYQIMISVSSKEKTRYIGTVQITLPDGSVTPCTLFEQNVYAYAPSIMAFFSLGYYIPYKKNYIIVHNMEAVTLEPRKVVSLNFLASGLFNVEVVPKSKFSAVINDPQVISQELYALNKSRREAFEKDMKLYFEAKIMEEIYFTDTLSICKTDDDIYLIFHYERSGDGQVGMFLNENYIEKIKENDSFLLEAYMNADELDARLFDSQTLERLLLLQKKRRDEKSADESGDNSAPESSEEFRFSEIDSNKTTLTKGMIETRLESQNCTGKTVLGGFLLFLSLYGLLFGIFGIGSGNVIMAAIALPVWGVLTYFGVNKIRLSIKNRKAIRAGEYKIIKATCTGREEMENEDGDGNVIGKTYTHSFSNGETLKLNFPFAIEGDPVYIVYLNGNKKPGAFYNAIEYRPDSDLVIEK